MKCSRCGHVARSLPALGKHAREKHASAIKAKAAQTRARHREPKASPTHRKAPPPPTDANTMRGIQFCPHCGWRL